jgi:putative YhbY family RNA-binding protein
MQPPPNAAPLTPAERKLLKAQAHHLKPVVMVGDAGLTPAVLAETGRALDAHGLIKVRVQGDDRDTRLAILQALCTELGCQPVQTIGKLLIVWRQQPDPEPAGATGTRRGGKTLPKKRAEARSEQRARRKPAPRVAPAKPAPAKATPARKPGVAREVSGSPPSGKDGRAPRTGTRSSARPASPSPGRAPAPRKTGTGGGPAAPRKAGATRTSASPRGPVAPRKAAASRAPSAPRRSPAKRGGR